MSAQSEAVDRVAYMLFIQNGRDGYGTYGDRREWREAGAGVRSMYRDAARELVDAYLGNVEWKVPR